MSWDIATADEAWLIDLCHQAEKEGGKIGGPPRGGDPVIKVSDDIAVKYGMGVTAAEAATQEFAYNSVDPNIVHVPRVYRFIERELSTHTEGYLFMEYVPGQSLKDVDLEDRKDIVPRIAKIVAHLGQIQGGQRPPGPVGGGEPEGYIWGLYGARTVFNSVKELNTYMNIRLKLRNVSIDLAPHPLVLCHLDLCRRNMILSNDGHTISLVDWGYAGLYPRFFEFAVIPCILPYDAPYEKPLLQEIYKVIGVTDEEKRLTRLVQYFRAANMRCLL